jgi:plasmid replication initiation protein
VVLGFSPGIAPYLTMLHTEFTRFKLKQVGAIGSFYGVRLYELCAQFRKAGERTIGLDRLREMLDLGEKYDRIETLRRRVLDPAVAEINRHTDLRVVLTPQRSGRKVVGFHFDITQDDQLSLDLPASE